ncbi:MAG TPA: urease accessory protein UreD [Hydrogenophaga sp.]|uniref:urease accessory protein UreD n=1 Tax=Hydrogenophaga sp. TaxID=1904254 RepID=UPI002C826C8F|nr:urease accessory protein UreD [Hydrogenophaga sp.]HMN93868.1 urease accessory protein UreD [Hydrogenophaga sp.]HMP11488.1 urease accessory protein UreD [Hydrogenophaga sp.]
MPWHASLQLDYHRSDDRTRVSHRHEGPLRVLRSLYPEGSEVCHNVIVHPPGGIVGGDRLDVMVTARPGAHGLLSTPGATRFYDGDGEPGEQHVRLKLEQGARLEWLPLETIAYPGCQAMNTVSFTLEPGSQLLAWDVVALGLPAAGRPFDRGRFVQRIEWPGRWLEQARLQGDDQRLMESRVGLGGRRALATLWFACGSALDTAAQDALIEAVRDSLPAYTETELAATWCHPQLLVVRGIGPVVEPLMQALQKVWAALRQQAWGRQEAPPRIWQV